MDANFETIASNTLQPLNMIYNHNIVTRTIAYIFINDSCNGLPFKSADERGNMAYKLFQNVFQFE